MRGHASALAALLIASAAACGGDGGADTAPAARETQQDDGAAVNTGDGTLSIGYVLPQSGQLAYLGPPTISGAELAVQDVNAAGGVLGEEVQLSGGDEGDGDGTIAKQTTDRLLARGVDAIVGTTASAIALTIIDEVKSAGVVMCSPANTSPTLTTYPDDGLYFRTVASDGLQGPVVSDLVTGDGYASVVVLVRADDYGENLAENVARELEESGAQVDTVTYDPATQSFDADVDKVASFSPEAVVLISFDEGVRALSTMIERGLGPDDVGIYWIGYANPSAPKRVDPDDPTVLDGVQGTVASYPSDEPFLERVKEYRSDIEDTSFAAHSYDCVVAIALAALQGGADDPATIAENLVAVTRDGTECESFEDCSKLLDDGEDIDYQGAAGPLDFTDAGEPSAGTYDIWEYDGAANPDDPLRVLDTVTASS
ncbi:MAG TPA: ABC transporter substrate-binding protein [Actinomycetota bacterium]|nr:ABC transporter substrate-binding protein [Actinomycetota bacterium]